MDLLNFWLLNPSNTILLVLLTAICWIGWRAQATREDVDFVEIFRDDNGKLTWGRFAAVGSFVASTWVLTSYASLKILPNEMLYAYLGCWSGSAVVLKALDIWGKRGPA